MTALQFADQTPDARPLHFVTKEAFEAWLSSQDEMTRTWLVASGFNGSAGTVQTLPAQDGGIAGAVAGLGSDQDRLRTRFLSARVRAALPDGTYALVDSLEEPHLSEVLLGWLLAGYTFGAYREAPAPKAMLFAPSGADRERLERIVASEALVRDLINTPANDMGPAELAAAAERLSAEFGATYSVIEGEALLDQGFPMIHTVGRAATRAPRLIEMRWGNAGPAITLVGKGVCFDTGGLNLKPGSSMALMKKDMGGAANVLGLARMIMSGDTPVQLRVLIPAVENAVAGDAFRPGDILNSRKGLTVEINNTDAEGRLVLADALALADEEEPELIISMATLTGAARVAVGPDLAPFYATHDPDAAKLAVAADQVRDPVWRLPLWAPYEAMIEPGIADLDNAPKGGFAGSITAALFLNRFVTTCPRYMHFDVFGWTPANAPGRPKGGAGQGIRALYEALPELLDL